MKHERGRFPVRASLVALLGLGIFATAGCKLPDATEGMKEVLREHGSIDAEWEIRDEAGARTYTYVLLRNKSGVHELYELIATDAKQEVVREQIGGIDSTGCYLYDSAMSTPWIEALPTSALEDVAKSGTKTRTACLEYKDTPAWAFIPAKERKAAEPPPAPPAAPGPDAGTSDAGAPEPTPDDVESAMP